MYQEFFFEANQKLSVIYNFYEILNKIHGGNLIIFGRIEKLSKLCTFRQKPLKMVGHAKFFWKVSIQPLQLQIFWQNVHEKFPGVHKICARFLSFVGFIQENSGQTDKNDDIKLYVWNTSNDAVI